MTDLLSLPDDTLIAVLALLPPTDLFLCRAVCRRLRDLCLHPDLWRSVRLRNSGTLRAALRLAPCLREVEATSADLEAVASMVASTTCVIEKLDLAVQDEAGVALATAMVLKVAALGGLRKLYMHIRCAPSPATSPLFIMAITVDGLHELYINFSVPGDLPPIWFEVDRRPSLTKFVYASVNANNNPFLSMLVKIHAPTLECVRLYARHAVPVSLITLIPRLRSLVCSPLDDLPHLLALPHLATIDLLWWAVDFPTGTLDFIRQASTLQSVTLRFLGEMSAAALLALAESRSARLLTSLRVRLRDTSVSLDPLAAVIHLLPSLRTLRVNAVPSDDFLRAVSPSTTPCLTSLTVQPDGCPHGLLHDPAVQHLLVRNCNIHLRFEEQGSVDENCECRWCQWGCHSEQNEDAFYGSAFASHKRTLGCPRDCRELAVPRLCA